MFLRNAHQLRRDVIVEKLVKFDVISAMCDVMQTSDENFVKYAFFLCARSVKRILAIYTTIRSVKYNPLFFLYPRVSQRETLMTIGAFAESLSSVSSSPAFTRSSTRIGRR